MIAVFWIFSLMHSVQFSVFAKEVRPFSRAKTVIPRDNLYSVLPFLLEEWMPSLVYKQPLFELWGIQVAQSDEVRIDGMPNASGWELKSWCPVKEFIFLGRMVVLVCSSPDRTIQVRALARDMVLCSWGRHFILIMPLSAWVYKWVPANLMLRWTSIPSRVE